MHASRSAWVIAAVCLLAVGMLAAVATMPGESGPRQQSGQRFNKGEYRVLEPLESGSLTLFPVVRSETPATAQKWQYITLDEGLRSGEVVVTEYGKLGGMVRPHGGRVRPVQEYGDRVNTLVLVNDSERPLMLLAGEIVTGGKQDRVIGKDRIVAPKSEPIDLSVFCIEHGRWTETSGKFGAAASSRDSFMVQPQVRSKAMVAQDQQQVWNSVQTTVEVTTQAAAPSGAGGNLGTTSYAKAMNSGMISREVDKVAAPLTESNRAALEKLKQEHAVGVVVAVHGEIIWADVFATPEMLAAYWTKLVRSYAAESFENIKTGGRPATRDLAEQFINLPARGEETTEGETGLYRYREVRARRQSSFYLEVLMESTPFEAHMSRVVEENGRAGLVPIPTPVD